MPRALPNDFSGTYRLAHRSSLSLHRICQRDHLSCRGQGEHPIAIEGPLRWFAVLVLFTPFVLAAGFVYSPLLKMFAGFTMVVAMSGLAVLQLILAAFVSSG